MIEIPDLGIGNRNWAGDLGLSRLEIETREILGEDVSAGSLLRDGNFRRSAGGVIRRVFHRGDHVHGGLGRGVLDIEIVNVDRIGHGETHLPGDAAEPVTHG